jgi:hypothetical protein
MYPKKIYAVSDHFRARKPDFQLPPGPRFKLDRQAQRTTNQAFSTTISTAIFPLRTSLATRLPAVWIVRAAVVSLRTPSPSIAVRRFVHDAIAVHLTVAGPYMRVYTIYETTRVGCGRCPTVVAAAIQMLAVMKSTIAMAMIVMCGGQSRARVVHTQVQPNVTPEHVRQ